MLKAHVERALGEDLDKTVKHKHILACVGSGGVGKTTTAAAIALHAANQGKQTLVVTIDPAKRLADSLGLNNLGHEIRKVSLPAPDDLRHRGTGALYAMMLDQKRAFDDMVAEHAQTPDAIRRILRNPVYQQVSTSLAGAQEYAAIAKVHELDKLGQFDLIVVDTPPTAHALDFVEAPEKLTEAIASPAIDLFHTLRHGESSVFGRTGGYILKKLAKFVGSQFLEDVATFFTEFKEVLSGFHDRAQQTAALLREERTGFILVTSPEAVAMREALFVYERLTAHAINCAGVVVNRVHCSSPASISDKDTVHHLATLLPIQELGFQPSTHLIAAKALIRSHQEMEAIAQTHQAAILHIRQQCKQVPIVPVPLLHEDVHYLDRLGELGEYLFPR